MNNTEDKTAMSGKTLSVAVAFSCASMLGLPAPANAQTGKHVRSASSPTKEIQMVAPALEHYTRELLLDDVWKRPDLSLRDRSMVMVTALVASGQTAQITYHLNRAMDNGLTEKQAGEMLTQLAFYAGWPTVFSALPVFKDVFEKRNGARAAK